MVKARGRPVAANRLLETIEAERNRRIHEQKLREIKTRKSGAQIDNSEPIAMRMHHVADNLKKRQMQKDLRAHIDSRNQRVIKNLEKIMDRHNPYELQTVQKAKSININYRRKELVRINEENKLILQRLQRVEPVLSAKRLDDEFAVMKKQMRRLRQHVPTIDIYVKNPGKKSPVFRNPKIDELSVPSPVLKKPTKPSPNAKRRAGPQRPNGGRKINSSVRIEDKKSPDGPPDTAMPTRKKLVTVGTSEKMTLRKIFEKMSGGKPLLDKKKLLRGITMSPFVREELEKEPDLAILLKPHRYASSLKSLQSKAVGDGKTISLDDFVDFANSLHRQSYDQALLLQRAMNAVAKEEHVVEVEKKLFVKAIMRSMEVQQLLHQDEVLSILLKPRKYMAALMEMDTHKDGHITLDALQHFANELHHDGHEGVLPLLRSQEAPPAMHKVEWRGCRKLMNADTGKAQFVACLCYFDPLEHHSDIDDKDKLDLHIEGVDLYTQQHFVAHRLFDPADYKNRGVAMIAQALKELTHVKGLQMV